MEVDFSHGDAVGVGFRIRNERIGRLGGLTDRVGEGKAVNHFGNAGEASMLVMVMVSVLMFVVVMSLLVTVDGDTHMGAGDALANGWLCLNGYAGEETVHAEKEFFFIRAQLVERGHKHIARRAHGTF